MSGELAALVELFIEAVILIKGEPFLTDGSGLDELLEGFQGGDVSAGLVYVIGAFGYISPIPEDIPVDISDASLPMSFVVDLAGGAEGEEVDTVPSIGTPRICGMDSQGEFLLGFGH